MPSASNTSNSSNIKTNLTNLQLQSEFGSRLLVSIELPDPSLFAAGDIIRYDISTSSYKKSCADTASNSEVFGAIESIDDGVAFVVTYGSINYPSTHLINITGTNYGGNDIYFLSSSSPGKLVNIPPSNIGEIIKPIYQVAPHSSVSGVDSTGTIVNYVGYVIQE